MLTKLRRAVYRVWQFKQAVSATVSAEELKEAHELLAPGEMILFEAMPVVDQRHCLDVFHYLSRRNCSDIDVLKASLLHDAGKTANGRAMRLGERVAVVLLDAISPAIAAFLASPKQNSSRHGFYLHVNHPEIGGARLEQAGSTPAVIRLVRGHEQAPPDQIAKLLKQADEAS